MQRIVLAAIPLALAVSAVAHAEFLGLDLADTPDIVSGLIDVTYDSATDAFAANGTALSFDDGVGSPQDIFGGVFTIAADVDDTGTLQSGELSISGNLVGSAPLLSGDLVDIGFSDGGGMLFEFIFLVTGGDLAAQYGGLGAEVGIILSLNSGAYSGDWSESFDNLDEGQAGSGLGVSDVAPLVPGPAALALFAIAAGRRRRRRLG